MSLRFLHIFLEKGAIHGLPYVGKGRLTVLERVVWLILTFVALVFCIILALQSLDRFNTKSTVISLERDFHYWNSTLPSITICPMERLSADKFAAYCADKNITGSDKTELFNFLESLANSTYFNFGSIKEYPSIDKHNLDPNDYMHLIYNLTENHLHRKEIKAEADIWTIHSEQVLTEWGICYTLNNYLINNLSTSSLLLGRTAESNPYEDTENLVNVLCMNVFDGQTSLNFIGFPGFIEIYIHGAFEVMEVEKHSGSTNVAQEFTVRVYDITASEDFEKSTTVDQRKCRFPHESNLAHFPIYTRNLCHQECRINLAYKLCNCVPHFYPNHGTKKPVCHYKILKSCLVEHAGAFRNLNALNNSYSDDGEIKCDCLPNCRSSEILEKKVQPLTNADGLLGGTGASIIMKIYPNVRYQRQTIFTLTDFLVSVGGTAGFFLGSSVLSAVEIIYYFTVRLIWHCCGYKE